MNLIAKFSCLSKLFSKNEYIFTDFFKLIVKMSIIFVPTLHNT